MALSQTDSVSGLFLSVSLIQREVRSKVVQASEVSRSKEKSTTNVEPSLDVFPTHKWVILLESMKGMSESAK